MVRYILTCQFVYRSSFIFIKNRSELSKLQRNRITLLKANIKNLLSLTELKYFQQLSIYLQLGIIRFPYNCHFDYIPIGFTITIYF